MIFIFSVTPDFIHFSLIADGMEERYLPAGTMKEYWIQYRHQSQSEQQASFPTFWRVPFNELTFMSGFRFRTGALEDVAK